MWVADCSGDAPTRSPARSEPNRLRFFAVSTRHPVSAPASVDIDAKLSYRVGRHVAIGLESYYGTGEFAHFGRFGRNDQSTYATIDTGFGRWDLNLGRGRGCGANNNRVIVKAVIGVSI